VTASVGCLIHTDVVQQHNKSINSACREVSRKFAQSQRQETADPAIHKTPEGWGRGGGGGGGGQQLYKFYQPLEFLDGRN
jgi:hypothetical protein